jgi:sec-independent protein translocase protein TatA
MVSFLPILGFVPGPFEWMIIAGVGLLIFGKRLPEVGRGLGRTIVEFKKGLRDVGTEIDEAEAESSERQVRGVAKRDDGIKALP